MKHLIASIKRNMTMTEATKAKLLAFLRDAWFILRPHSKAEWDQLLQGDEITLFPSSDLSPPEAVDG